MFRLACSLHAWRLQGIHEISLYCLYIVLSLYITVGTVRTTGFNTKQNRNCRESMKKNLLLFKMKQQMILPLQISYSLPSNHLTVSAGSRCEDIYDTSLLFYTICCCEQVCRSVFTRSAAAVKLVDLFVDQCLYCFLVTSNSDRQIYSNFIVVF